MGSSSHLQRIEPSALPAMYSPAAETHRLPDHQGTAGAQRLHRTRMRVVLNGSADDECEHFCSGCRNGHCAPLTYVELWVAQSLRGGEGDGV